MTTTAGPETSDSRVSIQVRSERRQVVLRNLRARQAAAQSRQSTFLRRAVLLRSVGDYAHRH